MVTVQNEMKVVLKDLRQRQIDAGIEPNGLLERFDLSDEVR
jgi:hypothetical protein